MDNGLIRRLAAALAGAGRTLAVVLLCASLGPLGAVATVHADEAELESIRALVRDGKHDQALARLDGYLAENPGDPQARFLKGVSLAESGQVDEAIAVFEALTRDYPKLPEPHNNLAVLHASKGDYDSARDALLVAINTHPSYATAHENLGDIYAKMARIAYDRALSLNNDNLAAQAKLDLLRELFSVRDPVSGVGSSSVVASVSTQAPRSSKPATSKATKTAEPATAAKPATTTAPTPAAPSRPATLPGDQPITDDVAVATVQGWAAAWSRQDVNAYLSYYGRGFRPADGRSRSAWEFSRKVRLTRPGFIRVNVSNFEVRPGIRDRVVVTFDQTYRSDTYQDAVRKRLEITRDGSRLQIVSERTVE